MMMSSGIFSENKNILFSKGFLGVYSNKQREIVIDRCPFPKIKKPFQNILNTLSQKETTTKTIANDS